MLLSVLISLAGLVLDPRVITGAPAWLNAAQFSISITLYSATLLWLLTFVQGRLRLVQPDLGRHAAQLSGRDGHRRGAGRARYN